MPAVTVDDILTVRPLDDLLPGSQRRPVLSLTTAPSGFEGEGFPVRRAFAGTPMEMLDPFIHMDQMGEVEYAPGEPKGTPWHPHRGFETVTYIIDGTFQHRDSAGGGGLITNGDTQWMTAGSGILHIERPPQELVDSGGLFHGIQLWVNLPAKDKMVHSRYQDIRAEQVGLRRSPDGGALLRIIAGDLGPSDHATSEASAPGAPTPPSRWSTPRWRRAPSSTCRGAGTSTRWSTYWPGRLGGRRQAAHPHRPVGRVGAGDVIHLGADRTRTSVTRLWRSSCSAANPSASR